VTLTYDNKIEECMGDLTYFLGLLSFALGIIFGVVSAQGRDAGEWIITVIFLFVGSVLLTRARRDKMREDN
jgi:uncharacterized membrane protein